MDRLLPAKEVQGLQQFDGRKDIETWYRRVTDYMTSRAPDIMPLLKWAGRNPGEIVNAQLATHPELVCLSQSRAPLAHPAVLSHHVYGLLAGNLTGHTWDILRGCEQRQSLEAWRKVLKHHISKTEAEKLELESEALRPSRCQRKADLETAILRWEDSVRRYHESLPAHSSERLSEERRVNTLHRLLPVHIERMALSQRAKKFKSTTDLEPHALPIWNHISKWQYAQKRDYMCFFRWDYIGHPAMPFGHTRRNGTT